MAGPRLRVTGQLVGTTEVAIRARGHQLTVDEPPVLGGVDLGANPVEHALIALASCQAITYRFWAAQLGIKLDGLEVVAEGDLDVRGFFGFDDSVRPGFTAVRLKVIPSGPETRSNPARLRRRIRSLTVGPRRGRCWRRGSLPPPSSSPRARRSPTGSGRHS